MRKLAIIALAFLALTGCQTVPGLDAVKQTVGLAKPLPPPPPDPKTVMEPLETRIVILIEEQRQKLEPRVRALAIDPELVSIARARAQDMAAKNYLAHAAPNGDTSASLLMVQDEKWQGLLGENLAAQHYRKEIGVDVNQFAQRFLETWMKSQPHRENLSYSEYDRTGVGAAVNGDTVYVAQLFASDMGLPPPPADAPASTVTPYASPVAAQADKPAPPPGAVPLRLRGAIAAPK